MTTETNAAQNDTDAAGTVVADADGVDAAAAAATPEAGGDTPSTDGAEAGAGDAQPGAPEQYEAFTYPENFVVDEGFVNEFADVAKALNLTQEQAQQFVDFEIQRTIAHTDARQQEWSNTLEEWKQQISKDEELGGARYDQTMTRVAKARDAFGTDGFKTFLDESGLGDHPEVVRYLARVGDAISEDRLVSGDQGASSTSRRMYKNSNMN